MAAFLLDTNVLIALLWPSHVHYQAARRWFSALTPGDSWATCPITESGFVRVSANHKTMPRAISPHDALVLLNRITAHPGHVFWEDNISLTEAVQAPQLHLRGHQQVTDAYLLGLAIARNGHLATFDQAIISMLPTNRPIAVALLPA